MTKLDLIKLNYIQQVAASNIVLEIGRERSFGLKGEDLSELYSRVKEVQSLFYYESLKNDADLKVLTQASLKLSHLLSRFMPVGVVEITKSEIVPIGKVKIPPTKPVTIYYGWSDTNALPTIEEIKSSNSFVVGHNVNYIIPFQQVQDWKYLWFWEPLTEPIKTDWEEPGNPLNKGQIGGATNLFRTPKDIGDGRWFITAYLTIADAPLLFKSGGEIIPDVPDPVWTIAEPPVLVGNDTTNILTATQVDYPSDIVYTTDGINWVLYTAPIVVGDNDRPVGYWKFKVREIPASYVHESSIVDSPEFHKVPPIIQYTLTVNVQGTTGATIYVNGSAIVGNTITVPAGTVLTNIVAIKSGYTMEPASYPSVTMDADKTLGFVATVVPVFRTLTVIVNGLLEPYEILIDGVPQPSNILTFPDGTVLNDISIQVDNYDILPVVIGEIIMDQNRTALFNATLVKRLLTIDTGGITGVDVYVDEVLYTGDFQFDHGTVLNNISLHKAGYTFAPTNVPETIMDANKTLSFVGTPVVVRTLTIDVQGTTGYTLEINGQVKTGTTFQYNDGTVINNVKATKPGWRFTPANYPSTTMDSDKTLVFIAEEVPVYTLTFDVDGTTDYEVRIGGVVQPSGVLSFPEGTVLNSITLTKQGFTFTPPGVSSVVMDSDKILHFVATEDMSTSYYMVGYDPYNPFGELSRPDQNPIFEVPGKPGVYNITGHRTDFVSAMRLATGGEYALKVMGNESTQIGVSNAFPYNPPDPYDVFSYSAGPTGKDGFYGDGITNKMEVRHYSGVNYSNITLGDYTWLIFKRERFNTINIYEWNGSTERFLDRLNMGDGHLTDYMYIKGTIWDEDFYNYPQGQGLFDKDATHPPSIRPDNIYKKIKALNPLYGNADIMVSVNGGVYGEYINEIIVPNEDLPRGYYKFKTAASGGRLESSVIESPKFTIDNPDILPGYSGIHPDGVVYTQNIDYVVNGVWKSDLGSRSLTISDTSLSLNDEVAFKVTDQTNCAIFFGDSLDVGVGSGIGFNRSGGGIFTFLQDNISYLSAQPTVDNGDWLILKRVSLSVIKLFINKSGVETEIPFSFTWYWGTGNWYIKTMIPDGGFLTNPCIKSSVVPGKYVLTVTVDGVSDYDILIDGVIQPAGILQFDSGTILNNISLAKLGYTFSPVNVPSLLMDSDKELMFTATETPVPETLPGFDKLILPVTYFTSDADEVYTPVVGTEDTDVLLSKELIGDGSIAVQFGASWSNVIKLYFMNEYSTNSNNIYYNIRIDGNSKVIRMRTGGVNTDYDYSANFNEGDFIIITRIGTQYYIQRSIDGVNIETLTDIVIIQLPEMLRYLKVAASGRVFKPQTKGFTDIP